MRAKFYPIVAKYKSPYTRREEISLLDLIIFSVLCMIYFSGVYKRGYEFLVEYFGLFPKIRYNKIVKRINKVWTTFIQNHKGLRPYWDTPSFLQAFLKKIFEIQKIFLNKNFLLFIDTIPIETKELVRKIGMKKSDIQNLLKNGSIGYNPSKTSVFWIQSNLYYRWFIPNADICKSCKSARLRYFKRKF